MKRIARLDGVRAVAFLTIFVHHGFDIPHLWAGVDIFFVLSGFLITSILMDARGKEGAWSRFYERRALRILPPYLVFLLLATFFLHLQWDHKGLWYALFAMNFAEVFKVGVPGLGILWSLAVEEQFYLFWPFVALRFSPRVVLRFAVALVILAPILRGVATPFLPDHSAIYYLMPFRMDLLAAGAALSVLWREPGALVTWRRWGLALMGSGLLLLAAGARIVHNFSADGDTILFNMLGYSLICCVATGLLAFTLGAEKGWWAGLMTWRPVRWIGLISYTSYLVHAGILAILRPFPSRALNCAFAFAVVVAYASLSWFFLEKPILQLRPSAWLNSLGKPAIFPVSIGIWMVATVLFILLVGAIATRVIHQREVDTVPDEQKIARSLEIIRTSTPENRKVLKVLFYGQSITRSGWDKAVIDHWHQKYPNTVFVVQNRALGGFASPMLLRATGQDITAFYPDLIIFHVYGDHRAYEQIIRLFRSRTAADIIVQTDHGESLPDPPCTEGLRSTLHQQPGCTGLLWVKQRNWYDEMSYHKIPGLAKQYGLAMEPQRAWWRDYLLRTHVDPNSMLADGIHPNEKGKELIAAFFNRYFDSLVDRWNGQTEQGVVSIPASASEAVHGQETIQFDGSRLELISSKPLSAWPNVTIDGTTPNDIDGCYQVTRASSIGTVPDWPALRRISIEHDRVPEEWTATLTNISPDQKSFEFAVISSVAGDEGHGDSSHDFVSKSGNLSIEAQDWMVERAFEEKHIPLQQPFVVHWAVMNVCNGEPESIDRGNGAIQYRYVLGTGLPTGAHVVKLLAPPNDFLDVTEFRAYKPQLHG